LSELWDNLGQADVIRPSAGTITQVLGYAARTATPNFSRWAIAFLNATGFLEETRSIFDPKPIEKFLREAVDPVQLRRGIELWITAFPALKIPGVDYDLLTTAIDLLRAQTGTKAHWLRVQDYDEDETLYTLLLASAAIPLAFPQRAVNGQFYVDGGLADNVPLGALAARGITHAIVIHLENGSVWDRHDFPNQTIIEIRPVELINKSNAPLLEDLTTFLDFSPERITLLKQRGYADAKYHLEPIMQTLLTVLRRRMAQVSLIGSTQRLSHDEAL
jgi:NTE family protein